MQYPDLKSCLRTRPSALAKGPLMVLMSEDGVALDQTIAHHLNAGFAAILVLSPNASTADADPRVLWVRHGHEDGALHTAVSAVCGAVPLGTWLGYGYNSEFLFYPYCEDRTVGEMLTFHAEERRAAMTGVVVDLYAPDLVEQPLGVDLDQPHLDMRGYYGLNREDPKASFAAIPNQVDIYGGLRWRYEEHIPWKKRRIDRVMLFRTKPGLTLQEDFTLSESDLCTLQCDWHHNLTCAMASFRTAKALMRSPGARSQIQSFVWPGSARFNWTGKHLMALGLMEPGQWF